MTVLLTPFSPRGEVSLPSYHQHYLPQQPYSPRQPQHYVPQQQQYVPQPQIIQGQQAQSANGTLLTNDCGCGWATCPFCNGRSAPENDVACISLGSWCGVAQCLRGNNLRNEALPFDWNRISLEGVMHFLENGFQGFLEYHATKDFPWDKAHGGLAYCGKYHSFWHDDLTKPEEREKYQRRIKRFFNNPARTLLFVRSVNESAEVTQVEQLLQLLRQVFQNHEVWLLIIVDHQRFAETFVLQGTRNRLLIHTAEGQKLRTPVYYNDVKAYDEAILTAVSCALGRAVAPNIRAVLPSITNLQLFARQLQPFFAGFPQEETWDPKPIAAHGVRPLSMERTSSSRRELSQSAGLVQPRFGESMLWQADNQTLGSYAVPLHSGIPPATPRLALEPQPVVRMPQTQEPYAYQMLQSSRGWPSTPRGVQESPRCTPRLPGPRGVQESPRYASTVSLPSTPRGVTPRRQESPRYGISTPRGVTRQESPRYGITPRSEEWRRGRELVYPSLSSARRKEREQPQRREQQEDWGDVCLQQ